MEQESLLRTVYPLEWVTKLDGLEGALKIGKLSLEKNLVGVQCSILENGVSISCSQAVVAARSCVACCLAVVIASSFKQDIFLCAFCLR